VALARLGDHSGFAVLVSLLDRKHPGFASLSPDRQEEVMVSVLRSLAGIRDPEMRRVLRRLTKEDGSPRIRNEARRRWEGGSLPPGLDPVSFAEWEPLTGMEFPLEWPLLRSRPGGREPPSHRLLGFIADSRRPIFLCETA